MLNDLECGSLWLWRLLVLFLSLACKGTKSKHENQTDGQSPKGGSRSCLTTRPPAARATGLLALCCSLLHVDAARDVVTLANGLDDDGRFVFIVVRAAIVVEVHDRSELFATMDVSVFHTQLTFLVREHEEAISGRLLALDFKSDDDTGLCTHLTCRDRQATCISGSGAAVCKRKVDLCFGVLVVGRIATSGLVLRFLRRVL